jgi:hypothetical protein
MQEEGTPIHNYVYSSALVEFVLAANNYCAFLEGLEGTEGRTFIEDTVRHLSLLYASILATGDTEPVLESPGEPTVSEQEWSALFQKIALILGPHNEILRMAREGEFDRSELVNHTISEDLADLYQELKDFTIIYSRGLEELMNDAAWELKERFAEHWGAKLLRALQALHELYVSGIDPSEEE